LGKNELDDEEILVPNIQTWNVLQHQLAHQEFDTTVQKVYESKFNYEKH
jgi:hypothetical protein